MKSISVFLFLIIASIALAAQTTEDKENFARENGSPHWKLAFSDKGTGNWQGKWFVDGVRATIVNSDRGMLFSAGPVEGDDACHSVLWTKKSFKGDIKITYDYTRTDTRQKWVNIIYIQATGIDSGKFVKDIREWSNLRMIPYMSTYFKNMKALHISYAAYSNDLKPGQDYIRLRRYPLHPGSDFSTSTEIPPAFFDTKLFEPGKIYRITIIKRNGKLYFQIDGEGHSNLYSWNIREASDITEGRIGLRHMYTRSALYKNFQVFTFQ